MKLTRNLLYLSILVITYVLINSVLAAGDPAMGQQKSGLCQGCHGPDGNSLGPSWPSLAGQHSNFISKQIKDFKSGNRQDPTMNAMVMDLSDKDIADIAAYFAKQKLNPAAGEQDGTILSTGKKIYKGGNTYNQVPACAGCHGPNGIGNGPANYPRIAGQQKDYLIKSLNDFKTGARTNDPNSMMRNIAAKLTAKEIAAVASYVASLK